MKLSRKIILLTIITFSLLNLSFPQDNYEDYEKLYQKPYIGIGNLKYFEQAYPDILFERQYDKNINDWIITVSIPSNSKDKEEFTFYWANGSFLPKSQLINKDKFWSLLTYYPKEVRDPASYSENEIKVIADFGSTKNRKASKGTPMYLFDAIYDTKTRLSTETHIKKIKFLNKTTNIHERIEKPLKRVESKLIEASKTSKKIKDFLNTIKSYDSYSWREIQGTGRRSFHGLGLAIDMMPKYLAGKHIFWSWTKDRFPDTWMTVSLKNRWMPPEEVINIFESEGFIWGGKWIIFDNMHFEYHPELLLYNYN